MSISGGPGDNFVIAEAATAPVPLTARIDAVPPHAYFVGSAIFHYLGPSFAVLLFARVAVLGVYLLTHVHFAGQPIGVAFAFANAALFAAYIVLAHRVARRSAMGGVDGLAAAMLFAFVFVSPIGFASAAHALGDPVAIGAGIGVGVSSSVIPYVFDQLAMARLARATYALFVALLPATATVVGVIVLRQLPTALEVAGIALVMAGIALHREAA